MTDTDPLWQRLAEEHPKAAQGVEEHLARDPEGREDPNNRRPQRMAITLALAAVEAGHTPPMKLDPLLRRACRDSPEIGDNVSGHEKLLRDMTLILRAMDMERREALLLQEHYQIRMLCWSLALLSETLTPAVAERAAWKLSDLGERENHGGTWTQPYIRSHQRALFPALGAVAVPSLKAAFDDGARRKLFLVEALGETRCTEAATPLVELVGHTAANVRDTARAGINKLLLAGHQTAILKAASMQLKAKKKGWRIGAAEVLTMLTPDEAVHDCANDAIGSAKDDEVKILLDQAASAEEHPDAARYTAFVAQTTHEHMAQIQTFRSKYNDYQDTLRMQKAIEKWPIADQLVGIARLLVSEYTNQRVAIELIEKGLLQEQLDILSWGILSMADEFEYDSNVTRILELLEEWKDEPPFDVVLGILRKGPAYRSTLYEYIASKGYFLAEVRVQQALARGLADRSKAVVSICKDALLSIGADARPYIDEMCKDPRKSVRKIAQDIFDKLPQKEEASIRKVEGEIPTLPETPLPTSISRFFGDWKSELYLHEFYPPLPEGATERPPSMVSKNNVSPEELDAITQIDGLCYLSLDDCAKNKTLPDAALAALQQSPSLRWLGVNVNGRDVGKDGWLTDKSLQHFAGLDALEALILQQHVKLKSLKHLPTLPSLQVLSLSGSSVKLDTKGIEALQAQPSLHTLVLNAQRGVQDSYYHNSRIDDKTLPLLNELPQLRHLSLRHCERLKGPGLEGLSQHPGIMWLDLTACYKLQNVDAMTQLARFPSLRILDLEKLQGIDTPMIEALAESQSITALQVDALHFDDDTLEALTKLKTLRHLSLRLDMGWKEKGSRFPLFSDKAYGILGAFPHLESLRIEDRMWNRTRLEHVVQLPIHHLLISPGEQLSTEELTLISQMQTLKSLWMSGDRERAAATLKDAMPHCHVSESWSVEPGIPGHEGIPIELA